MAFLAVQQWRGSKEYSELPDETPCRAVRLCDPCLQTEGQLVSPAEQRGVVGSDESEWFQTTHLQALAFLFNVVHPAGQPRRCLQGCRNSEDSS